MATIAATAPFKNNFPKRSTQKLEESIVTKHGLTNNLITKVKTDIIKPSYKIIYTTAISALYQFSTQRLMQSKPLISTHLYRSTVTGTGTEESYGRTGQVYPTGFN